MQEIQYEQIDGGSLWQRALQHGMAPDESRCRRRLPPCAAERGFRCVALDLQSCGEASHTRDAEPSITELAHTVVEAVDAICTSSSFDVVGHQAGASVAMRVALTYPQRVRRLVLWGIPILDSTLREQLLQLQPPQPPDTRKNHPAAVLQSPHNRFPDQMQGWPVQAPAVIEMLQMREERAWLMQAAAAMDHEVALRAIQQPVLCMAGDSEVFQAATMRAASILPRGRYWHLRNGGTDVVDWYPEEYTRLIVDFLLKH